jgi:hypothetical protein
MYCVDIDDSLPTWLKAHVVFMQVAHAAEVVALRYTHERRDISPEIARCLVAVLLGKAEEARRRAATHMPFPVSACPSLLCLN